MKKREFLKVTGTLGGASALGVLPFSSLAQLANTPFATTPNSTGNARAVEMAFMTATNINAGNAWFGFIFTVGNLTSNGALLDVSEEVQPVFAKRTHARVVGPTGRLVHLWVEFDPITYTEVKDGMRLMPNDDNVTSIFVRLSGPIWGSHDQSEIKRAIDAEQVAKAAIGGMAVEFGSEFAGQLIARFACVYVPEQVKAFIERLAGEETAETIARWVQTGVGVTSTIASAAFSAYMTAGLGKWIYQNPKRLTTPMGMLGVLLYLGPPVLSVFSSILPHIPNRNQSHVVPSVIPPNIAAVWAASYGRSAAQTLLDKLFPGIKVPPIIRVWHSNSQLVIDFDTPQLATKWLVAFSYYGTSYGIGAASRYVAAAEIFKHSQLLGIIPMSTLSAAGEAIDGAVGVLGNAFHPSAKYIYNDAAILEKAAKNFNNLWTKFGSWAFHRDVASRVLNINTGFINYFMQDNTDVSFYGVSASSNVANALVTLRKVWLMLAETALNPTAAAAPSYAPHERITAISYRAVPPDERLYITMIGVNTVNARQSFAIRTDREQVTTVVVETPLELVPVPGG